jgi:SAM-dependent methyltransferase
MTERRLAFGPIAELYEQIRPSYPQQLVDHVLAYAQLEGDDRILEVGAGTGKATRQFATGGYQVVALEPSAEMAAVARTTCRGFSSVSIVQAEFERWTVRPSAFKLVISAQAWHWIAPELRYEKARPALKRDGALAVFWSHADWQKATLRPVLDHVYQEAAPNFADAGPMHPAIAYGDLVPDWTAEITAVDGFDKPEVRNFPWSERYRADEYVRLLSTHSDHLVLEPEVRERLLERVAEVIVAHGGELEVPYVTRLCLARAI